MSTTVCHDLGQDYSLTRKEYSLTDSSMETMRQEGITEALTHDNHFTQEGFTKHVQHRTRHWPAGREIDGDRHRHRLPGSPNLPGQVEHPCSSSSVFSIHCRRLPSPRWVRSGEPRISRWLHLLEPALDLRRKAVDRVLTRAPNERGDPTLAVDEKMERRVCEFGAKAPECLGTGEVGRHGRMDLGQGRAHSLRLLRIGRRGHHCEPPVRLEALPDAFELATGWPCLMESLPTRRRSR